MEREFDLIVEPWICVRADDLTIKEISLKEALLDAHKYKGLAGETKTQDFAVLRMLLAIIHTIFSRYDTDGDDIDIEDDPDLAIDNWIKIWNNGSIPAKPVERYFEKWHDRFWLFDENYPFYQSKTVRGKGDPYSTAKMIGSLFESGNKPRLFSDRHNEGRLLSYPEAARWLLHINCFDDIAAKKPTPKRTWAGKLSMIAVVGDDLFETLMLNYNALHDVQKNGIFESHPSWESDCNINEFNRLIAIPNDQASLLSLISRRVFLCRKDNMVTEYYVSGGDHFEEDDVIDEQMTLWKGYKEKKDSVTKFKPKVYDTSKKVWQEFGSISAVNKNNSEQSREPGIIGWINFLLDHNILSNDFILNINTAAIKYDFGKATSLPVIDMVSDELTFHSQLLLEVGSAWRERINIEIEKCDKAALRVYFLYKDLQKACGRSDKDNKTELSGEIGAKEQFYDMIDRPFRLWLAELSVDNDMDEYSNKLETDLRKIALDLGKDLVAQVGETSIFGRYKKNSEDMTSSAEAIDKYEYSMIKIFDKAGDRGNEQE